MLSQRLEWRTYMRGQHLWKEVGLAEGEVELKCWPDIPWELWRFLYSIRVVPQGADMAKPLYHCCNQSLGVVHPWKGMALVEEGLCHCGKPWRSWQLGVLCWQHSQQLGQQFLSWRGFGHTSPCPLQVFLLLWVSGHATSISHFL